jgi:HrpA-like RNA helicase
LRQDPELNGIDAVLFDEFHERGVGSDTALARTKGDVLALLPGVAEIRRVIRLLQERGNLKDSDILPLYGALLKDQQDSAIFPTPDASRRVIFHCQLTKLL